MIVPISAVVSRIKTIVSNIEVHKVWIQGEVSNLTKHRSGHYYFSIKDNYAELSCVMFSSYVNKLTFSLEEGMKVLVKGSLNVYEQRGNLQLYVRTIKQDGMGELFLEFEKRKEMLFKQGYFEDSLEDIRHALKVTLGEEDEDEIKTFSFSVNEEYEAYSPGKGKRSERSSEVLPSFIGKTVTEAEDYCSENGIVCNIEYVDPGSEHYNSCVNVGLIGDQSVPISTFLGNITDITFYVVNSREAVSEEPSDEESSSSENDENKNNEEESTDNNDEEEIPDIIEDMLF